MLKKWGMRLVQPSIPTRPLLSSISAPEAEPVSATEESDSPFALRGARTFSGNGRAIFVGIVVGGILICAGGAIFNRHQRANGAEPLSFKRFLPTKTHSVSASPHEFVPPAPVVVPIDTNLLHVTAISLGHPRLAVVNGQSVAEGDWVRARPNNLPVTVSLRVLKIGDGRIDLSDGQQVITAKLAVSSIAPNRSN